MDKNILKRLYFIAFVPYYYTLYVASVLMVVFKALYSFKGVVGRAIDKASSEANYRAEWGFQQDFTPKWTVNMIPNFQRFDTEDVMLQARKITDEQKVLKNEQFLKKTVENYGELCRTHFWKPADLKL